MNFPLFSHSPIKRMRHFYSVKLLAFRHRVARLHLFLLFSSPSFLTISSMIHSRFLGFQRLVRIIHRNRTFPRLLPSWSRTRTVGCVPPFVFGTTRKWNSKPVVGHRAKIVRLLRIGSRTKSALYKSEGAERSVFSLHRGYFDKYTEAAFESLFGDFRSIGESGPIFRRELG